MVAPETQAPRCCLLWAGPNLHSLSAPKIFICYMMHESTLSSHTTLHDPWPHLHRCNMTQLPPSILACGVDSMNFYYAACVCHPVWLFLLILIATSVSGKYITLRSKMEMLNRCKTNIQFYIMSEFGILKSWEICTVNSTYWVCLFVCFVLKMTIPTGLWQADFQPYFLANESVDGHLNSCLL